MVVCSVCLLAVQKMRGSTKIKILRRELLVQEEKMQIIGYDSASQNYMEKLVAETRFFMLDS